MVAANSASALTFNDAGAANDTLSALKFAPNIVTAAVLTPEGQPIAIYRRVAEPGKPDVASTEPIDGPSGFSRDRLRVTRDVMLEGRPVGHVSITSDLNQLAARRTALVRMSTIILALALLAAWIMSRRSQRAIAGPIVELAELSQAIALDQDYSRRARTSSSAREVTTLVQTFNHMLEEIEDRNRSLTRARAELETRVKLRTAELDAANQELEAFSYSVSHDLRAPIRHVTGFSELLEEHAGPALDDQGRKYLKTITAASSRMARLVDDLLAFSRIGRAPITRERVDLNRVAAEARDEVCAQLAATRNIVWRVDPLPKVDGDASMLHLVMVNLLSNAVKYSSTRAQAEIEIGTTNGEPGEVVVFVRDNGVGFDMQYADKLFGVFQRLHRANEFEGTGIGLAHIKRIVTRHGGRVWASSEVDRGATFSFSLPVTEKPS
jgi:signal transduction histidine kinase